MTPKFGDLKRYCDKNGWVLIKDTDHWYYEKVLQDGTVLKTKISHSVQKEIPKGLWNKILKQQLRISEQEFRNSL